MVAMPALQPNYHNELCRAMQMIAENPKAVFIGQGAGVAGTTMSTTFRNVPQKQRLEFPVAEELQMGTAIGMALGGFLPVCIFPRWNFILRAADQLINHLDRLPLYSDGGYKPKVIIRTAVPSTAPFNPGPQHDDDFTEPFRHMLRTVHIQCLQYPGEIMERYQEAVDRDGSTILVEYTNSYRNERANA